MAANSAFQKDAARAARKDYWLAAETAGARAPQRAVPTAAYWERAKACWRAEMSVGT
jgi:hypothetical protein